MSSRQNYLGRLAYQVRTMTRPRGFAPDPPPASPYEEMIEDEAWAAIAAYEARVERVRAEFRARYYSAAQPHTRQSGHSVNTPSIGVFSPRRSRRRLA
jgi:hypothetical protein